MKKRLLLLGLSCAVVIGAVYKNVSGIKATSNNEEVIAVEVEQNESISKQIISTKNSAINKNLVNSVSNKEEKLDQAIESMHGSSHEEEYRQRVQDLALEIDKYKLDIDELNDLASEKSFEEFMNEIPVEVANKYRAFKETIEKMQKENLKEDGMDASFFTKYEVTTPTWISDRKNELDKISLPSKVLEVVNEGIEATSISDNNIKQVLNGCGKKNIDCIEKAVVSWIDAKQALTDDQHNLIKEYL